MVQHRFPKPELYSINTDANSPIVHIRSSLRSRVGIVLEEDADSQHEVGLQDHEDSATLNEVENADRESKDTRISYQEMYTVAVQQMSRPTPILSPQNLVFAKSATMGLADSSFCSSELRTSGCKYKAVPFRHLRQIVSGHRSPRF